MELELGLVYGLDLGLGLGLGSSFGSGSVSEFSKSVYALIFHHWATKEAFSHLHEDRRTLYRWYSLKGGNQK